MVRSRFRRSVSCPWLFRETFGSRALLLPARGSERDPPPGRLTHLRNRRMLGLKFRRQKVIRGFIVDFYCAELRLVLELDGSVHDTPAQRAYDRERDAVLRGLGLAVVRLPNASVRRSTLETLLSGVLESDLRVSPLP